MTSSHSSDSAPDSPSSPPPVERFSRDERCHWCGYALRGLTISGTCPECGQAYTSESARRLQPWPSALMICLRLGWPLIGLAIVVTVGWSGVHPDSEVAQLLIGYALVVIVPVNSYFQVRGMLKRSLPAGKRTRGPIAVMRAIGTAVCIVGFLLLLVPFVLLGACLIMLQGMH